ncbi:MAG: ABC transporter ATP-binding protein [Geminicoccaceae bacterium]|nr:ABC transporter ATP-binding protein [Geminicoccaceae bacterium]
MSLRLQGVSKFVGDAMHLDDIDLDLEPGRPYVLLGPTTAGKTSLMRIMAGLDRPTEGKVFAMGADVTGVDVRRRDVAMVYQQFINYPAFTVYDNIAAPLRMRGLDPGEIDDAVRRTAAMVHIAPLLDRLPGELSGGQQQRCAIARALVKESGLLLLDEPLVNLDYKLREELRAELQELFTRRDSVVVYATTEPLEALIMGGEVIVMHEGRVLQVGSAAAVHQKPGSYRVAHVFADPPMNTIDVAVRDGEARGDGGFSLPLTGHLADLPQGRIKLGVRANHLSIDPRPGATVEIDGVVELSEISGSETFVHVAHNRTSWVVQETGVKSRAIGDEVRIHLDPSKLYAFGQTGALEAAPDAPPAVRAGTA